MEIDLKDLTSEFWMPSLNFEIVTSPQKIGTLRKSDSTTHPTTSNTEGYFGLKFDDYDIFNWGKDYLAYQAEKIRLKRDVQNLQEERRELKLNLILAYFKLYTIDEIQKVYREQKAAFIYRLNREKVLLKKISKQDYYQSRMEYFRSQAEFMESQRELEVVNEEIKRLIVSATP